MPTDACPPVPNFAAPKVPEEQPLTPSEADSGLSIVLLDGKEFVRAGTVPKLIEHLIADKAPDPEFVFAFMTTFRSFVSPMGTLLINCAVMVAIVDRVMSAARSHSPTELLSTLIDKYHSSLHSQQRNIVIQIRYECDAVSLVSCGADFVMRRCSRITSRVCV